MDTQTLNNTPNHRDSDKKSEKVKKVAGESAKFAAAAGIGVAGTMAANAMNNSEESVTDVQDESQNQMGQEEVVVEDTVEVIADFNPNDIMIEDVEEEDVNDDSLQNPLSPVREDKQDYVAVEELQPITGENIDVNFGTNGVDVAIVDVDDPTTIEVEIDPEQIVIDPTGEPNWENINEYPSELLASEDLPEPDVLGDILA